MLISTGGHDCGFDCCWAPVRVERFEEADNAGNMRAGHGSSRDYIVRSTTFVRIVISWACCFAVGSKYVHPWCCDIRLQLIQKRKFLYEIRNMKQGKFEMIEMLSRP
jgi:hypothetical protein